MCHHYRGSKNPPAHLAGEFSARTNLRQLCLPEASYYPLNKVPVVRHDDAGDRELVECEWGLLPYWWKPKTATDKRTAFQRKCFNARSEDVHAKPSYREAFRRRRCLLPAVDFMEKAHYFSLPGKSPFAFAGLWDRWRDGEGQHVETCTLLTTAPNAEVLSVGHHRMPVILTDESQFRLWLDAEIVERGPLDELIRPLADGTFEVYAAKG